MSTLQGKKLAAVVAEVLDEKAAAELEAERAKVREVVDQVTRDLIYEQTTLKQQIKGVAETEKRLAALNKRLKLLKAGDQGALKAPPAGDQGALKAPPAETIGRHEAIHANLVRDMEVEAFLLRNKRFGPHYSNPVSYGPVGESRFRAAW